MMRAVLISTLFFTAFPDSSSDVIVATVGRFTITARDLMDSYEFGPAFVKQDPDPLRKHLQYMIYERLIALDAKRLGYDTSLFVRDRVVALEEDLTVEQLYREDILSKVTLSREDIEQAVSKAKTILRLRWISSPTADEAQRVKGELDRGVPFDSLFAHQKDSIDTESERKLETTILHLERDNPEFLQMIQQLKSQEISQPLEGPDGFYIVRIDEIWRNPLVTESEYGALRTEATEILREIRAGELAHDYVKRLLTVANPIIKAEGFNIVRAYLADKGLSRDKRIEWRIPATFMTEAGPMPIADSAELLHHPLLRFQNRTLQVRDYLLWFDIRQFQLKTRSLEAFNTSVKRTIWKMVQDKLLSEEAYQRGLQHTPSVASGKKKWEAKLLYLAGRSHWLRTIKITDDMLKRQFEAHKQWYGSRAGKDKRFDEVRDYVWLDVYYDGESQILFRLLQRLSKEYPVHLNEVVLAELAEHIAKEKNPINVILYKPGGTFPRVAFPTIDEAWQRYP